MRQRNRRLLDQVTDLRTALREKQEALHLEQMRSRDREILVAQQSEELNTLQEQLTRLFHALESSHQAAQRQQILIETLSEQLQSSQERVAQLERECALTQQRYNEQSHQLLQAANTCRELRTRLHRQQQQTLQFKTALEKSLEMPSTRPTIEQQSRHRSGFGAPSVVPKAQPIQPWSAEPEVVEDSLNFASLWNRPIQLDPPSSIFLPQTELSEMRRVEEMAFSTMGEVADAIETTLSSSEESVATEQELEQQLLAEMTSLAEASGLSDFQSDLVETEAPLTPELGTQPDESDELASYWNEADETPWLEDSREVEVEEETPTQELWGDSTDDEPDQDQPDQPENVVLPQSNWPSPVLYPLRTPKKRKSLSAIDLPSFPRFHPS